MINKFEHSKEMWMLINGQVYILNHQISLTDLFEFLNHKKPSFITEYNQVIITPKTLSRIFLTNYDKIEFITVVGGG